MFSLLSILNLPLCFSCSWVPYSVFYIHGLRPGPLFLSESPKRILLPIITVLCVLGSYAYNNSLFDVVLMFLFGILGFAMRKRDYPVGPLILGLVLGGMMDSQLRTAVSLASSAEQPLVYMFSRPITIGLTVITVLSFVTNTAPFKKAVAKIFQRASAVCR